MKYYYIVEGWEDKIFRDEEKACEFLMSMTDFYTDDSLVELCEQNVFELSGEYELQEHLTSYGFELEDVEFIG